jgi:large subunit ribosomal protein L22
MNREVKAQAKYVTRSARKIRLVADAVRGMNANLALASLKFMPQGGAADVYKVVASAVANATHNHGLSGEKLIISKIMIDVAPTYKRIKAESKGRARRILKRNSHITVYVAEPVVTAKPAAKAVAKPESSEATTAEAAKPAAKKPVKKATKTETKLDK